MFPRTVPGHNKLTSIFWQKSQDYISFVTTISLRSIRSLFEGKRCEYLNIILELSAYRKRIYEKRLCKYNLLQLCKLLLFISLITLSKILYYNTDVFYGCITVDFLEAICAFITLKLLPTWTRGNRLSNLFAVVLLITSNHSKCLQNSI